MNEVSNLSISGRIEDQCAPRSYLIATPKRHITQKSKTHQGRIYYSLVTREQSSNRSLHINLFYTKLEVRRTNNSNITRLSWKSTDSTTQRWSSTQQQQLAIISIQRSVDLWTYIISRTYISFLLTYYCLSSQFFFKILHPRWTLNIFRCLIQ